MHLLDEPVRETPSEGSHFRQNVSWVLCCSCGWESKPTQYSETAETLGVAHLVEEGVKVDTDPAIRVRQGWGDDR